jgi:hypothetical protein
MPLYRKAWLELASRSNRNRRPRHKSRPKNPRQPALELLENRWLPSNFLGAASNYAVLSTSSGVGTSLSGAPGIAGDPSAVIPTGGFLINGVVERMDSGARTVATFVDPSGNLPTDFYSADIAWGDGSTTAGAIFSNPVAENFTVFGSHTYADEGSYIITATIHKVESPDSQTTDLAIVSDPPVVPAAGSLVAVPEANGSQSVTVATFTDPGGPEALVDYSADIIWGDGSTTAGTVTFNASMGVFSATGTHAYADEGRFLVFAIIHHDMAPAVIVTDLLLATEADMLAQATATPIQATEGTAFSGAVAFFTDINTVNLAADFTATIDWGDGTTTPGTVSGGGGLLTVSGSHTYAEENTYNLKITLVDKDDDGSGLATAQATGNNTALVSDVATVPVGGFTVIATEGTASTCQPVATFTDPAGAEALSSYSADIDWGDSSTTAGQITFDPSTGTFSVGGSHNYADEGQFSLTVTIHHETAAAATVNSTADVAEADVLASAPAQPAPAPVQGSSFTGDVAAFTDSGYPGNVAGDFTASIDWGDGTTTAGTVSGGNGLFTVSGTHAYTGSGPFTMKTTLSEDGGAEASATVSVDINVSSTPVANGGFSVAATEGNASGAQTVATFTDPAHATDSSTFSADIVWGDGATDTGTITFDASTGAFTVEGNHTYAQEGTQTITVTIHHGTVMPATATSTADVADAALTAQGTSMTTEEGVAVNGTVATFTDANPGGTLSDFTASIDWGDGSATPGTVSTNSKGGFEVSGQHVYFEDGHFTITASVHDLGGQQASATTTVNVTEPALVGTPTPMMFVEGANTNVVVATFTHGARAEGVLSFVARIDWGDGSPTVGTIALAADGTTYLVFGTHIYTDESRTPVPIIVTISDLRPEGDPLKIENSITINSSATVVESLLHDGTRGTANQRFLSEVYHDLLQRDIDTTGLANWGALLEQGVSRTQVVFDITQTTEFRFDEINALYFKYLNRAADPFGAGNALVFLQNGGTVEQVAENIILSNEFAARVGSSTTQAFLNQVYLDTFNRQIDQKGLSDAEQVLGPGPIHLNSPTLRMVIENIFTSDEYIGDLVSSYYHTFLDRDVELDPGFIVWTNFLKQGRFLPNHTDENAIAGIVGLEEYFSKTQA